MAVFTNPVDFVADGDAPGSVVPYELTRYFHPALSPSCGPERGSRSALIVVAHVFSWPQVGLRHVRGGVAVNSFKQVMHPPVATAQDHDVRHMDVAFNLKCDCLLFAR